MARSLAVDDVIEVRIFCEALNQTAINTLHYRVTALGIGGATDASLADPLSDLVASAFQTIMSPGADYNGIRLQVIKPTPKAPYQVSVSSAGPGTNTGDMMSPQVAGLLTKLTAKAGSRYRGLVYIPFMSEADNGPSGDITSGGLAKMNAFGLALLSPLTVAVGPDNVGLQPIVYSKKFSTSEDVLDYRPSPDWGTHKSRSFTRRGDLIGP